MLSIGYFGTWIVKKKKNVDERLRGKDMFVSFSKLKISD